MQAGQDVIAAILDWYSAVGVDCALSETPIDRFAESRREAAERSARAAEIAARGEAGQVTRAPAPRLPASSGPVPAASGRPAARPSVALPPERPRPPTQPAQPVSRPMLPAGVPDDRAVMSAREAARSAASLDELRRILESFEGCNLRLTARRLVFADGNPSARLMLVGEAPGKDEDEQGLPFVGRSGQLLDRMLGAVGLDRGQAYIANVVPWRPPGNRTPTPQETEICRPFVMRQIELVDPDILVFLGGAAAATLAGAQEGILKLRGRWLAYQTGTREIRAMATLHPAYLLRQPIQKRLAWRDLVAIRAALG